MKAGNNERSPCRSPIACVTETTTPRTSREASSTPATAVAYFTACTSLTRTARTQSLWARATRRTTRPMPFRRRVKLPTSEESPRSVPSRGVAPRAFPRAGWTPRRAAQPRGVHRWTSAARKARTQTTVGGSSTCFRAPRATCASPPRPSPAYARRSPSSCPLAATRAPCWWRSTTGRTRAARSRRRRRRVRPARGPCSWQRARRRTTPPPLPPACLPRARHVETGPAPGLSLRWRPRSSRSAWTYFWWATGRYCTARTRW